MKRVLASFLFAILAVPAAAGDPPAQTLHNGVRILVAPHPGSRTFSLRLVVAGGACEDPVGMDGASTLLARMLLRSSETILAGDRALRLEAEGVSIGGAAGTMGMTLWADGPASAFELACATLFDAMTRPRLDPSELARETALARQALASAKDDPSTALRRAAAPLLYGDHCLARVPPEDPASWLTGVDAGVLRAVMSERLAGSRVIVAVAGDVDPSLVVATAQAHGGSIPVGRAAPEALAAPVSLTTEVRVRAHRRTSQPEILVAMPTAGVADADSAAMGLLAHILGGFQERLSLEIREKRGWAYWLSTVDQRLPGAGSFGVITAVPRKRLAETESLIRAELARIASVSPSDDELERARRFLATQRARERQSTSESATRLARAILLHVPIRTLDEETARDAAVTPDQIRSLARRLLDSSKLAVVTLY